MACKNLQGDRLSVGVARNQVRNKASGVIIGGYAAGGLHAHHTPDRLHAHSVGWFESWCMQTSLAEYKGHAKAEDVKTVLTRDLQVSPSHLRF